MLEARRARRYECHEGVDCEMQGGVVFGLLADISITGARLRGLNLPAVGTLLRIAPALEGPRRYWVFCQVAWMSKGEVEEVGLRFLEPSTRLTQSWVGELCRADEPFERRESVRLPLEVPVQLKAIGQKPVVSSSADLSREGALVLALSNLRRNERVDVNLRLPSALLQLSGVVVEPGSTTRAYHAVRFEKGSPLLDEFLSSHRPSGRRGGSDGLALLRVMNGR